MQTNRDSTAESTDNPIMDKLYATYNLNPASITYGDFDPQEIGFEASTLIHLNPKPSLQEPSEQQIHVTQDTQTNMVLAGNGDFILDESILKYVEFSKKTGRIIDNLTIAEIEISANLLYNLLTALKPMLKALYILRVPLDHEHLEMLNKLSLNIEFLAISFPETNQSNTFRSDKQKQEAYRPFDINKLDFKNLSPCLKYLELQGLTWNKGTFGTLIDVYSETLEILIVEELQNKGTTKQELIQHILQNVKAFKNLKGFSLAKNNLDSIDFAEDEIEEQEEKNQTRQTILFPETLTALNLKGCNLNNKQVHDLVGKLNESQCPLKALHLEGSYIYSRTKEAIVRLIRRCCPDDNNKFLLEISKQPLEPSDRNPLEPNDRRLQNTIHSQVKDIFTELLDTSTELESLKESKTQHRWMTDLLTREGDGDALSYLLKLLRKIKFFNAAYRSNIVDFSTKTQMLIPKHDFNELLNKVFRESNVIWELGNSHIAEYDVKLIRKIHPQFTKDDAWAKQPLRDQRNSFLLLMKNLGYRHIQKKHKDCVEDQFFMALKTSRHVSYDYTLATFSLFWYYNQVSVKFNLSDDWYLDRKQRKNRYALPNQDFLISFCSEWNSHTNDYVFELEILNDGEPEVKFKTSIWKDGDLNVAKALLIAIDKGFVMLKALHKMELFDKGEVFKGVEDSRKVRRVLKEKLRKYANSIDFQNLLRQEKTLLPEEVEGEEHYSD